jgi:hypothetical protein
MAIDKYSWLSNNMAKYNACGIIDNMNAPP